MLSLWMICSPQQQKQCKLRAALSKGGFVLIALQSRAQNSFSVTLLFFLCSGNTLEKCEYEEERVKDAGAKHSLLNALVPRSPAAQAGGRESLWQPQGAGHRRREKWGLMQWSSGLWKELAKHLMRKASWKEMWIYLFMEFKHPWDLLSMPCLVWNLLKSVALWKQLQSFICWLVYYSWLISLCWKFV